MALGVLDIFNIDIFKLKNGIYNYQYEIDSSFFDAFQERLVDNGNGEVNVVLEKTDTFIKLTFNIDVQIELECDRSLDLFDHQINCKNELILKFGEEEGEITEEIIVISRDRQRINLGQYIYEFIGLSIPMKKLHPRYAGEEEGDNVIIYSSKTNNAEDQSDADIDPRWKKLKNLK